MVTRFTIPRWCRPDVYGEQESAAGLRMEVELLPLLCASSYGSRDWLVSFVDGTSRVNVSLQS